MSETTVTVSVQVDEGNGPQRVLELTIFLDPDHPAWMRSLADDALAQVRAKIDAAINGNVQPQAVRR